MMELIAKLRSPEIVFMDVEKGTAFLDEVAAAMESMHVALKDAAFALDGVIDGDFTPTGKTVRGALNTVIAALKARETSAK